MLGDFRIALRDFRNHPGFALVAILVLALGIGVNTAMFSVLQAMLFHPMPFDNPDRVVMLWEKNPALGDFLAERVPTCIANILAWQAQAHSFDAMTEFVPVSFILTGAGNPERLEAARAGTNFGDVFSVRPAIGRMFAPGDENVAILSHRLFAGKFGADPKILGRTIELNKKAYTVIGVWPASFKLPALWQGFDQRDPQVWVPLDMRPGQSDDALRQRTKFVYAHLRPGSTLEQARIEMTAIGNRLAREHPDYNQGFNVNVFPVAQEDVGPDQRRYVLILQGAVAFVLLIACANIANILLARSIARRKELAVRMAIGAGAWRLVRQSLVQSMLLSFAGAAASVALASWGIRAITALAPKDSAHLRDVHLDPLALAFTLAAAIVTGLIFGSAPALDAARRNVSEALNLSGRSGGTGLKQRMRSALVMIEVALALVLLVGAGLLIRTVHAMTAADPGFRRDGLISVRMELAQFKYPNEAATAPFCRQVLEKVSAIPGVTSASLASGIPMEDLSIRSYEVDGAPRAPGTQSPTAAVRSVTAGYFETMMIPIREGRAFTSSEADDPKSTAIVINETMAKKAWPGQDPIGKSLRFGDTHRTVVGVVPDVRQLGPQQAINPEIYIPAMRFQGFTILARTELPASSIIASITRTVHDLDPDEPVKDAKTLNEASDEWSAEPRFVMTLLGAFAALALMLAAVGLYGVLAYSVSQRTHEIGIRMALGATRADVLRVVVGEGLLLAAAGTLVGLGAAFALTRLLEGLIFGVKPTDPATLVLGVAVLLAASAAASTIPAMRATRIEPLEALRLE
jgi:putative ABC transport system permease protein